MKTVSLVCQKGGAGKSTLAINLAVVASRGKKRSLLIDLDPQGTAEEWYQRRKADHPGVITLTANQLPEALRRAKAANYDFVIIDTAGRDDPASSTVVKHSDFCLVPCRPTPADMEGIKPTLESLVRAGKPFAFVITQAPPSGFRIQEAEDGLESGGTFMVAPVPIVYRVAYQDAFGVGEGVHEYQADPKATREIMALWHWVNRQLRGGDA